jgi:hypothetical protein
MSKKLNEDRKALVIYKITCISFVSSIFFTISLWYPNRNFPLFPVFNFFKDIPFIFSYFVLIVLIASFMLSIFINKTILKRVVFFSIFLVLLADQLRLQPWVYIYTIIIFSSLKKRNSLLSIQFLLVGVYFWSGIHKLNSNFINNVSYDLLVNILNENLAGKLRDYSFILGLSIPLVEILISILLITKKFRNLACKLAILTHLIIIFFVVQFGFRQNIVIYVWNIMMILSVYLCFFDSKDIYSFKKIKTQIVIIILVWFLPILNFINYWDNYLSFSIFSGKTSSFFIETKTDKLLDLHKYTIDKTKTTKKKLISITDWSMGILNIPFYPEQRIFIDLKEHLSKERQLNKEDASFIEIKSDNKIIKHN